MPAIREPNANTSAQQYRAAVASRQAGQYILDSEIAFVRDKNARLIAQGVDMFRSQIGPRYAAAFSEFGIDSITTAQLVEHAAKIYQSKREAQLAIAQSQEAVAEFEARLQRILSPSDYAAFQDYESDAHMRTEMQSIESYAAAVGHRLTAEDRDKFGSAVRESGAYTPQTVGSPSGIYHEIPMPAFGTENVADRLLKQHNSLGSSAADVISRLRESGASQTSIDVARAYYNRQLELLESDISRVLDPTGSLIQRLQTRLTMLNANPQSNPDDLRRTERLLNTLRRQAQPRK